MNPQSRGSFVLLLVLLFTGRAMGDGPADNVPDKVRRVPPAGLPISSAVREELSSGVAKLGGELEALRRDLSGRNALLQLLPDVQIYHKAVKWALDYDEFFKTNEVTTARRLL